MRVLSLVPARAVLVVAVAVALFCTITVAVPASASSAVAPHEEYFGVIALPQDEEGVTVPLRNGDETLGFAKACALHNLCSVSAILATIRGAGDKQPSGGGRVVYVAHVVGDGVDILLRVVADTGTTTARGPTPDGLPVGVITAYCSGFERCPDEINQL